MSEERHSEAAFEAVIEAHLLSHGYVPVSRECFDRERAIFPETVLAFVQETQPKEWSKLEVLHAERTDEQVLTDLCKWMDTHGSLATLRHGFKCYGRTPPRRLFQGGSRAQPGARGALCRQPARYHTPTPLLGAIRKVGGHHVEPERDPARDGGAEESHDGADCRGSDAAVPTRPGSPRTDVRVQAAVRSSTSPPTPTTCA